MRRVIRQLRDRLVRRLLLAADRLAAEAEAQARAKREGQLYDALLEQAIEEHQRWN